MTGAIKDYEGTGPITVSNDDSVNQAATGTIIGYSEGIWKNSEHKMTSASATALEGKSSELNIGKDVILSARYKDFGNNKVSRPIGYLAVNKGKINATGNTDAKGYGSVLAYADNSGEIETKAIKAIDEWANVTDRNLLYINIGAVATNSAKVTINGNAEINGMGAMAIGNGSLVKLNGSNNIINTGTNGALAAKNGGGVNFAGGKIVHKNNEAGDHKSSTPFYADNSSSKVVFTGSTTIDMYDGILIPGTEADYEGATPLATAKYKGMNNVTVNLKKDNVVISINDHHAPVTWTSTSGTSSDIKDKMKLAAFNTNGHRYKIYYTNSEFNLDTDVNLNSNSTDAFNNVGLANEKFTILNGRTVSSIDGTGLAMGSLATATDNTTNQYINKGIVNITGGNFATKGSPALSIAYGTINNENEIIVDSGIGAYGINGSSLHNNTNGKISITTEGVGLAAFASAKNSLLPYGTDKKINDGTLAPTEKVLEVINDGTINVAGDKSIGIYAETNEVASHSGVPYPLNSRQGLIKNNNKIVMTGDKAVGILSKGNTVELNGTGSSNITVGTNGIGVYAENSPTTLLSDYGFEVKDNGTGIFLKNSFLIPSGKTVEIKYTGSTTGTGVGLFYNAGGTNTTDVKLVNAVNSTGGVVGLYASNGGVLTNNASVSGDNGYGIIIEGTDIVNNGTVTLNNPIPGNKSSVGLYTRGINDITNTGDITVGGKSVGIYGKSNINNTGNIKVGDSGTGIYSENGNVNLTAGSITVGNQQATVLYTKGIGSIIELNGTSLDIGNGSYGIINDGTGNTVNSRNTAQTVKNDTVYMYSKDATGNINNYTKLTSTGNVNYGLYGAGEINNYADIDFKTGYGNVGIYSSIDINTANTSHTKAVNHNGYKIEVGDSYIDPNGHSENNKYALGMAVGYAHSAQDKIDLNSSNPAVRNRVPRETVGFAVNNGIINVNGEYSVGMYGAHAGSRVENHRTINLNKSNTIGMFLDTGAYGYNYGTIQSNGTGLKNIVGIVVRNGATIENHGTIQINASNARGFISKRDEGGQNPGIIKNYGNIIITGPGAKDDEHQAKEDLGKSMGGIKIDAPAGSETAVITVTPPTPGVVVQPELVSKIQGERLPEVSTIGMYIDTITPTAPIEE